jgi:hypothetical protein
MDDDDFDQLGKELVLLLWLGYLGYVVGAWFGSM